MKLQSTPLHKLTSFFSLPFQMKRFASYIYKFFEIKVWIKLNATLWPRTQEDKEQVSTRLCRFFIRLHSFHTLR